MRIDALFLSLLVAFFAACSTSPRFQTKAQTSHHRHILCKLEASKTPTTHGALSIYSIKKDSMRSYSNPNKPTKYVLAITPQKQRRQKQQRRSRRKDSLMISLSLHLCANVQKNRVCGLISMTAHMATSVCPTNGAAKMPMDLIAVGSRTQSIA